MREKLHEYLNGEIPREELPEELRREAGVWDDLVAQYRDEGPEEAPPGLEGRVWNEIRRGRAPAERRAGPSPWRRLVEAVSEAGPSRLVPIAAAAAALAVIVWASPWQEAGDVQETQTVAAAEEEIGVEAPVSEEEGRDERAPSGGVVRFSLEAPDATSVAVAGDFTDWRPTVELQDRDGDGVWTGRARVEPGVHQYMFVVDESRWITDPEAERYASDGFGNRNAVTVVTP